MLTSIGEKNSLHHNYAVSLRKLEPKDVGYAVSKEKPVAMCSSTIWNDLTKLEQLAENDYLDFMDDLNSTPTSYITDDFTRTNPPRLCTVCRQPGHTKRNCPSSLVDLREEIGEQKNKRKEKKSEPTHVHRKKERTKKKQSQHCSNCGVAGHNCLHCPDIHDDGEEISDMEKKEGMCAVNVPTQKRTRSSENSGTEKKRHLTVSRSRSKSRSRSRSSSSDSIAAELQHLDQMELEIVHHMKLNLLGRKGHHRK